MLKACREIVGLKLLLLLLYGVNWTSCDISLFLSLLCLFGLANYWRKNSDSNENEVIDWNDKLKVNRFSQHRGRIFLSNILQSRFSSLLYLYVQTCVASSYPLLCRSATIPFNCSSKIVGAKSHFIRVKIQCHFRHLAQSDLLSNAMPNGDR